MDLFTLICLLLIFAGIIINAAAEDRYLVEPEEDEEWWNGRYRK